MSANNQLVVCYIKKEKVWAVFMNPSVDNPFRKRTSTKKALFKDKNKIAALRWAHFKAGECRVEYGVEVRQ